MDFSTGRPLESEDGNSAPGPAFWSCANIRVTHLLELDVRSTPPPVQDAGWRKSCTPRRYYRDSMIFHTPVGRWTEYFLEYPILFVVSIFLVKIGKQPVFTNPYVRKMADWPVVAARRTVFAPPDVQ